MTTFEELEKSSRNSIYIFHSDIQIQYRPLTKCVNFTLFQSNYMQYKNIGEPNCLDTDQFKSYYDAKKTALDAAGVKVSFKKDLTLDTSIFDYLFFSRTTLDSANIINVYNKDSYSKFENFLSYTTTPTTPTLNDNSQTNLSTYSDNMIKINQYINNIRDISEKKNDASNNSTSQTNMRSFTDRHVSSIYISVFFINQDIDKFGVVVFKYIVTDASVSTAISNYATEIPILYNHSNNNKKAKTNSSYYIFAIATIMILLLIVRYLRLLITYKHKIQILGIGDNKSDKKKRERQILKKNKQIENKPNEIIEDVREKNTNIKKDEKGMESKSCNSVEKAILQRDNKNLYSLQSVDDIIIKNLDIENIEYIDEINKMNSQNNIKNVIFMNKLWKNINKSYFLILAWLIYILENIYRFFHILKGTNDCFYPPHIILKLERRDGFLFFHDNIRLFKAIKNLLLFVHLIYVFFSIKELTIIRKLFQKGLIVFYIIVIIIILSISIFVFLILGNYFQEFSSLSKTFILLISYSLGIESTENIEVGTMSELKDYLLYVKIIVYFIRLIVINFSLIVMYVFYKKVAELQENKSQIRKQNKEEGKKKRKFERIKRKRMKKSD